ncbi:glucuronate isomerase [Maribacter sp. 2-571]|uniref:glucuronate isomerase n=1 Tax=Maribacter sp. 2-571 TaxID=3417569 RepID=UPI003D341EA0
MKQFMHDNFLLESAYAEELYHNYAATVPIVDYHNHLSPGHIAADHKFQNLTHAWLVGDHYKWRAMRTFGVDEAYVTGTASDREKFAKWAETVPFTLRNPLYHWTHLELKRYFGIDALLTGANAMEIYDRTEERLQEPTHSVQGLLRQMEVEVVCTTDDPIDSLEYHQQMAKSDGPLRMFPSFRPDKALAAENHTEYKSYLEKLAASAGQSITSFEELIGALKNRIAFFDANGCRSADHGMEQMYYVTEGTYDIETVFQRISSGKELKLEALHYFKYHTLLQLCREYARLGWVQQFHLGPLRNVNRRKFDALGPDMGFDSIGDLHQAHALGKFLNALDVTDQLAKTILYNLNPSQNEVFATMAGNFNDGSIRGKVQFGSGWWHMDQLDGMERQMNALSNMGLLSCFVGMLTDSRSFLSFPRHEYFRRLLCNIFGNDIQKGHLPKDMAHIGQVVQDICYHNANTYFNFKKK